MNIDFPLVLTLAVLVSGLIWLFDLWVLRPRRRHRAGGSGGQALSDPVLVEYARSFFPILLVVWALRSFIAEPFQIPSESMVPTLEIGDFVLVNKYAYGVRLPVLNTKVLSVGAPRRGDVMVFVPPHKDLYLIKRVIGIPDDEIRYANKTVSINGQPLARELQQRLARDASFGEFFVQEDLEQLDGRQYLIHRYPDSVIQPRSPQSWTLPAGAYFMLGDNRDRSEDSRIWGFAREEQIVGKAVAVWMHKPPGWHWPSFAESRWLEPAAGALAGPVSAAGSGD